MEQTFLKNEKEGLCLYVKVKSSSPRNQLVGPQEGCLKIRVKGIREKGKANKELISYLSDLLKMPRSDIILLQGNTKSKKKILLRNITPEQAKNALSRIFHQNSRKEF